MVIVVWEAVKIIKSMIEIVSCYRELKKLRLLPKGKLRIYNMQVNRKGMKSVVFWCIPALCLLSYVCYQIITKYEIMSWIYNDILLWIVLIFYFIGWTNLIRGILVYRCGNEAYLTSQGIVAINEIYDTKNCRFVIEKEFLEDETGDTYINVYKGKIEYPFRFKILERKEDAIEIIKGLQERKHGSKIKERTK